MGAALVALVGYFAINATSPFNNVSDPSSNYSVVPTLGSHHHGKSGKSEQASSEESEGDLFDEKRRFIVHDFDARSTFSNFLPGVAGVFGKPVWSFYVNRGQALASFGLASKDFPIMEFNTANKAYQVTPYVGFRTFIQGTRGGSDDWEGTRGAYDDWFWGMNDGKAKRGGPDDWEGTRGGSGKDGVSFLIEPFSPANTKVEGVEDESKPDRTMFVGTNELEIKEVDSVHGITTSVNYFVLPEEDFAALVRRTTITNTGDDDLTLSALDGLAKVEPTGGRLQWGLKNIGRTLEGWMGVYHANGDLGLPFYRMSTEPNDSASVVFIHEGHYCISFMDEEKDLLPIVYDTEKVFGFSTTLQEPNGLIKSNIETIVSSPQYGDAKTSSAFAAAQNVKLAPGESVTVTSVYGKADNIEELPKIAKLVTSKNFITDKFQRARDMMNELTSKVETHTANKLFDGTIKQNYLDNSLRGGMPVILGELDDKARSSNADEDSRLKVYHVFSRIHGDLERDYNDFNIDPTYFSQGPGNYRDVAQNRRNDVVFSPRIGAFCVKQFLSFIQADGYEPLTVQAVSYQIENHNEASRVAALIASEKSTQTVINILSGGIFRPGQLFALFDQLGVKLRVDRQRAIDEIMAIATESPMAVFGQGYWADHWDYYLDLIEAYTSIYPDGEESLMYDTKLRYFFSTATVRPRSQKYVEDYTFDGKSKHILQLDATYFDNDKVAEQEAFRNVTTGLVANEANWQRTGGPKTGRAFTSPAISKLFLLGAMKFSMRDAYGMGVEYEGGKPGWNDAMNGLAG
jgi:hypothetical protein